MTLFIVGIALLIIGIVAYFAAQRKPIWFFISGTGFGLLVAVGWFYLLIATSGNMKGLF